MHPVLGHSHVNTMEVLILVAIEIDVLKPSKRY